MNEGGDNDKLGRGVVWKGRIDPCIHQNHVFSVSPKSLLIGEWIALSSNAKHGRDFFFLNSKQSTNLASIAKSKLEQFPIALPPEPELEEIVREVAKMTDVIDRAIAAAKQSIERAREARASLITSAATGQIDLSSWQNHGSTDRRLDAIESEATA